MSTTAFTSAVEALEPDQLEERAASLRLPVSAFRRGAEVLDRDVHIPADELLPCWRWTAGVNGAGHPNVSCGTGHVELAHRLAFVIAHGPIPAGRRVWRTCRNKRCVAFDHIAAGLSYGEVMAGTPWREPRPPDYVEPPPPEPTPPPLIGELIVVPPTERRPLPRADQAALARMVDQLGADHQALLVVAAYAGIPLDQLRGVCLAFPTPEPLRSRA